MDEASRDVLDFDQLCLGCGTNLKGLGLWADCPACGLAVATTVRQPLLRQSEPVWVHGLARGAGLLIGAVVVSLVVGAVNGSVLRGNLLLAEALRVLPSLMLLTGVWKLTQREPGVEGVGPGGDPRSRRLTWGAALAMSGLSLVQVGALLAGGASGGGTAAGLYVWMDSLGLVAAMVAYFGLFAYGRRLAIRLPDARLAQTTRAVMWGVAGGMAMMLLAAVQSAVAPGAPRVPGGGNHGAGPSVLYAVPVCSATLLLLFCGIYTLVLLAKYRARLKEAAWRAAMEEGWGVSEA
ncbi:MAG: hypothetical protein AAGI68_07455 [Planctomycetota bacterium]